MPERDAILHHPGRGRVRPWPASPDRHRLARRGRRALSAVFALLGALLVGFGATAASASATTIYVAKNDPNCTNTGPGTATLPLCSISAAASRVTAGQTVQVA